MRDTWIIVLISAFTDSIILMGTSLSAAMVSMGSPELPSRAVLMLTGIGGLVAFARTIQQALKSEQITLDKTKQ